MRNAIFETIMCEWKRALLRSNSDSVKIIIEPKIKEMLISMGIFSKTKFIFGERINLENLTTNLKLLFTKKVSLFQDKTIA
jgi:hypothetical protein